MEITYMNKIQQKFAQIFNVPPVFHNFLDMVATVQEMELVLLLHQKEMTASEIADAISVSVSEIDDILKKAEYRILVKKEFRDGQNYYFPASFYKRVSRLSIDTRWEGVPKEVQESVSKWEMDEFIKLNKETAFKFLQDPNNPPELPNQDVLLMEEALAQVDAASFFALDMCDCRQIMANCTYPEKVCLALNEPARAKIELNPELSITKAEAKEMIINANRAGLIHTGLRNWEEYPELQWGLCNCCSCCCYPMRGGIEMGLFKKWPRAHFEPSTDESACISCGLCAERCQFYAFTFDGEEIQFESDKCIGCGICATGCPTEAISMKPFAT
jgi:ferredoxin